MELQSELNILEWYVEQGVTEILDEAPCNRLSLLPEIPVQSVPLASSVPDMPLGIDDARKEALRISKAAQSLDELEAAIRGFDGLAIKKTATNLVFGDGHPAAHVMIVGDVPGGDEDIQGKPFAGANGQLLDKMLDAIGLSRRSEDPAKAVYIANLLNWRPPGNRTPSPAEIEISLAFIERQIALVKPRLLVMMGNLPAKALLNRDDGIAKLRGTWLTYKPMTESGGSEIPCLPSLHPSYLIKTPLQKKAAWQDLLLLKKKQGEIYLK